MLVHDDYDRELRIVVEMGEVVVSTLESGGSTWAACLCSEMDTDVPENEPWDRGCRLVSIRATARCIRQEIMLGIGGVRLLRLLGYDRRCCT